MKKWGVLVLWLGISLLALSTVYAAPIISDAVGQIITLVNNMEAAVQAGDAETYLSYVDMTDETFATEHTNWAHNWADGDFLVSFELDIGQITVEDDRARGTLSVWWQTNLPHHGGRPIEAGFVVQFRYDETRGQWLYGGEHWARTVETDQFIVHAAAGVAETIEALLPELPIIYDSITTNYGYVPVGRMEIKLYATPEILIATTLLDLPLIAGWNEPRESMKSIATNPVILPRVVAHEFGHFLTFDQAGGAHPPMPWWLEEGIAEFFAINYIGDPYVLGYDIMVGVQGLLVTGEFVEWSRISNYEETPVSLWGYVYPQGFAFVSVIGSIYGADARNDWLHAMAADGLTMAAATQQVFGLSFDELDMTFRNFVLSIPFESE